MVKQLIRKVKYLRKHIRKTKWIIPIISVLLIIGSLGWIGAWAFNRQDEPFITRIHLQDLQPKNDFQLVGSIEPAKTIELKVDSKRGAVVEKKVEAGDQVKAGQALFVYSNPEGALAIKEAEQATANRTRAVEQARRQTNQKWEQYNKVTNQLEETKQKIASVEEDEKEGLEDRKTDLEMQQSQLLLEAQNLESSIGDAELELERAELELRSVKEQHGSDVVEAEIDGIVKDVDERQMNMSSSESVPENPFMTIVDTSRLFLKGTVDEFRRNQLEPGQKVELRDRNGGSQRWTGKITRVGDMKEPSVVVEEQGANPNLSQFSFEVVLDESEEPPSIGIHCFVEGIEEEQTAIKLPKSFVFYEEDRPFIYVVEDHKISKLSVEIMEDETDEAMYLLESELDMQVELVFPRNGIKAGMDVRPNDPTD